MSLRLDAEAFQAFCSRYDSDKDCIEALFNAKWPNGFRCPRCQHSEAYLISTRRLPLYQCHSCKTQTSVIVGTIMEGSRTPLRLWFQAIHLHARPSSVNARQLSELIGVTYKTAWLICHKIRHAMSHSDSAHLLSGIVRVSDALYCRRLTPTFELDKQEQSILIGTSDNKEGDIGYIKIKLQSKKGLRDKYDSPDPKPFIQKHVEPLFAKNTIITRRYGRGMNKTLVWESYYVTSWLGRLFRGIGPKHLQAYLDQYCYHSNHKNSSRFNDLLQDCAITPTITNPILIGRAANTRSLRLTRNTDRKAQQVG
ncbi:transposase [Cohnella luojiensis]|uniref:IS1595 family transposase n=1 Tax=Cohnella luojiensis TaxID=652876 RepID=A0A4Y8M1I1_9BACL|nr:transposase [Cohnella luojiensis]TFE28983.1 IS1595 family transposase [Cohnella luojiensis]